jgi:hypothetical protein
MRLLARVPAWLRESSALPLRVGDILLVISADTDRVSLRQSIGAEAETPTYFIQGEPTWSRPARDTERGERPERWAGGARGPALDGFSGPT